MTKFEKVEKYYQQKYWTIGMVRNAVGKWITKDEFEQITGETY